MEITVLVFAMTIIFGSTIRITLLLQGNNEQIYVSL